MQAYDLIANQDILYPKESQVYIHKIIPNEFSVNIQLKSKYCIYNDNKILKNDILTILYPDKQETKIINLTVNCENYFIDLTIVPTSVYIKSNNFDPGQFIINRSNIPYSGIDLDSFIRPIQEEMKDKVNFEISSNDPEEIAATILENLKNAHGTPSSKQINSNGYVQYIAAKSGKEKVWCANLADILVYFLHAKNIPARRVNLWGGSAFDDKTTMKTKYWFILAPGHTVVEYYHKGWHMADLTLNAFKFTYKNTPLSVINFKTLVDMNLEDQIVCHTPEGEKKYTDLPSYQHNRNSFNKGQRYTTFTHEENK